MCEALYAVMKEDYLKVKNKHFYRISVTLHLAVPIVHQTSSLIVYLDMCVFAIVL